MGQGQRRPPSECISHEELLQLLKYDPETGLFTWLKVPVARVSRIKVGAIAGHKYEKHTVIRIKGVAYQAHQLAWFYVHGKWPEGLLDHKDLDGHNNRILNLREATKRTNGYNRGKVVGKELPKWVYRNHSRFMARVSTPKEKNKYLGTFDTPELAHEAAKTYAKEHHGEFYCE